MTGLQWRLKTNSTGCSGSYSWARKRATSCTTKSAKFCPAICPAAPNWKTCWPASTAPASKSWKSPRISRRRLEEAEELLDLDLPAGVGEKVNDPVRMYLREMGTVPLLTREGEVEIARRIERGQNTVLKSLSRAPLVIQEIIAHGREMARDSFRRAT